MCKLHFFQDNFCNIIFIGSKTKGWNCRRISPSDSLTDSLGKDTNLIQLVEHIAGWSWIWWHPRLAFINYRYSRSHNFIQIHCSRCKIVRWSRWRSLFSDSSFRLAVNRRRNHFDMKTPPPELRLSHNPCYTYCGVIMIC